MRLKGKNVPAAKALAGSRISGGMTAEISELDPAASGYYKK